MNVLMAPYMHKVRLDPGKLRALRGNRSQTEVAEIVGVSTAQISNIEKGLSKPSVDTFIRLLLLYNARLEDVLSFED